MILDFKPDCLVLRDFIIVTFSVMMQLSRLTSQLHVVEETAVPWENHT